MECTNDHTLVLACVITNSLLNATPYGPSTDLNRTMVPNDQGPDPTLPRYKREYSLRDCRPPDPIRSSTHRLGFADFLGADPSAVGGPACTNKPLVQSNPLCVLDSEAPRGDRVPSNSSPVDQQGTSSVEDPTADRCVSRPRPGCPLSNSVFSR